MAAIQPKMGGAPKPPKWDPKTVLATTAMYVYVRTGSRCQDFLPLKGWKRGWFSPGGSAGSVSNELKGADLLKVGFGSV